MSASATKPCPGCAKPLRPDAANCWFCGRVFDIIRCVECGSPNRTGSPACQICGEPLPAVPLLVVKSDNPPVARRADEQDCPDCRRVVPLSAVRCKHCGAELDSPTRQQAAKWPGATIRRSRGGSIIAAAVVSLVWLLPFGVGACVLAVVGWRGLPAFICVPLVCGLLLCTAGAMIAFRDLRGIHAGRVNPDGYTTTLIGGWLNGFVVILYWCMIGFCFVSFL